MNARQNDAVQTVSIAIDDGFGRFKVLTSEGFKTDFPSVARSGNVISRLDGDVAVGSYATEGRLYTVDPDIEGEDTRFADFATSEINRVLVRHSMQLAGLAGRSVTLCTGVPFQKYFQPGTNAVNQELISLKEKNLEVPVRSLDDAVAPTIVRQFVMAQGLAAYFDYMTDDEGNPRREMNAPYAIVDPGSGTTDIVTVLRGGEAIDHAASGTAEVGVSHVYDVIDAALQRQFGCKPLKKAFLDRAARTKEIRWQGKTNDISGVVNAAVEEIAPQVLRELDRRIGKAGEMDAVLLVGGGAVLFHEAITRVYPHAVLLDDPAFANARGMLKVARFGAGHG